MSPSFMIFDPIISAPADPKTRESNAPILTMALCTRAVSYCELSRRDVEAD